MPLMQVFFVNNANRWNDDPAELNVSCDEFHNVPICSLLPALDIFLID